MTSNERKENKPERMYKQLMAGEENKIHISVSLSQ